MRLSNNEEEGIHLGLPPPHCFPEVKFSGLVALLVVVPRPLESGVHDRLVPADPSVDGSGSDLGDDIPEFTRHSGDVPSGLLADILRVATGESTGLTHLLPLDGSL